MAAACVDKKPRLLKLPKDPSEAQPSEVHPDDDEGRENPFLNQLGALMVDLTFYLSLFERQEELQNAIAVLRILVEQGINMNGDVETSFPSALLDASEIVKGKRTNTPRTLTDLTEASWAVCNALGLDVAFLNDRFTTEELDEHLPIEEWICHFLTQDYEELLEETHGSASLLNEDVLEQIGFRADAVKTLLERSFILREHLHTPDWVEMYVRDEFKYNPLLSARFNGPKFPFHENIREEWKKWEGSDSLSKRTDIKILNLEGKPKGTSYPRQGDHCSFPKDLEDENHRVLFHGTDHDSAKDIVIDGVRITHGRKNRDFSSGRGFYLTDDFEHAVEWAFSSTRKPAVLVYRVERSLLESFAGYSLVGEDKRNEWVDLVKQYRSGKPTKKLRKLAEKYDFIEGPRSVSSVAILPEPKLGTYQMCIISPKFAEELVGPSLHSAVFYDG